jgi:hypothetical protein
MNEADYQKWVKNGELKLFEWAYLLAGIAPPPTADDLLEKCIRKKHPGPSPLEVSIVRTLNGQLYKNKFYTQAYRKPFEFQPLEGSKKELDAYQDRQRKEAEENFNFTIPAKDFLDFCINIYVSATKSIPYGLQDTLLEAISDTEEEKTKKKRNMNNFEKRKMPDGDELIGHVEFEKILKDHHQIPALFVRDFWMRWFSDNFIRTLCEHCDVNGEYTIITNAPNTIDEYFSSRFFKSTALSFKPTVKLLTTQEIVALIEKYDIGNDITPKAFLYEKLKSCLKKFYLEKDDLGQENIKNFIGLSEHDSDIKFRESICNDTALFLDTDMDAILHGYKLKHPLQMPNPVTAAEKWQLVDSLLRENQSANPKSSEKALLEQVYNENSNLHKNFGNRANGSSQSKRNFVNGYKKWKEKKAKANQAA